MNITSNTVLDPGNVQPRGAENVMKNKPGPRGAEKYVKTPVEAFQLFMTDEMISNIVTHTNNVLQPVIERFSDLLTRSDKYPHFRLVDYNDIRAYLGLLYHRYSFKLNLIKSSDIWNHENENDLFSATTQNRFKFLSRFLTFDDKSTRTDRWKNDKFA